MFESSKSVFKGALKACLVWMTLFATNALQAAMQEDIMPVDYSYNRQGDIQGIAAPTYGLVPLNNAHSTLGRLRVGIPELMLGVYSFTFDYPLDQTFAVGPIYEYMDDDKGHGNLYGGELLISLDENLNQSGWQVAPYIAHYSGSYDSGTDESTNIYGINFIKQHIWPIGVFIDSTIGVLYTTNPDAKLPATVHGNHVTPTVAMTLGYAF